MKAKIALACGDGIGPEIAKATVMILEEAGAQLEYYDLPVGLAAYQAGHQGGIPESSWAIIDSCDAILKAPITTPSGGGVKSLNVTMRKRLGLAVNLRPCKAYAPYVKTLHPQMDLVIVRENEEDLYAGIEYQNSQQSVQAIKLITRPGCERIIRYAFDYAQAAGRSKVTALVKDNIMKMTDGMFWEVFQQIAEEYPHQESERMIVDIGMAKVADTPEDFEVIVCENLYGDILSDITAQLSGSVGLCGSANIGENFAMFEAIHGSAPDIAGKDLANPSGMLQGAIMMLEHLGQAKTAALLQNAWLSTLEDGVHTADLEGEHTKILVGTEEFAEQVCKRLGREPTVLKPLMASEGAKLRPARMVDENKQRKTLGADITVHHQGPLEDLLVKLEGIEPESISCRGSELWPGEAGQAMVTDSLCLRWQDPEAYSGWAAELQLELCRREIEVVSCQALLQIGDKKCFSALQGE